MDLETLPLHEMTVELCDVGAFDMVVDGSSHRKTCPFAILAQAVQGRYGFARNHDPLAELPPGGAFLAGPSVPLHIAHHGDPRDGNRMRARWIHLRITLFGSLDVVTLLDLPPWVTEKACGPFGTIIEELAALQTGHAAVLPALARRQELAFRTLYLLCQLAPMREDAKVLLRQRDRLAPVLALMKERLACTLSVAELARCANLSVPQFHVFFRRLTGQSPLKHMKHLRLSEACKRLARSDEPLRVIAEQTGFCNEFHLSRDFRAAFGKPPAAWRRDYGRDLA